MGKKSALFLDRDGTLIRYYHYLSDPDKVELLPGVCDCLRQLQAKGWLFFLHSNQSGVGRGLMTQAQMEACHQRMLQLMGLGTHVFARVCLPTSTSENPCAYRKPSPRFISECLQDFSLNPNACWMIGDRALDIETGRSAHIRTILMRPQQPLPGIAIDPSVPLKHYVNQPACCSESNISADAVCADFFEVLKCVDR
jgi:D-glycero-D-manno-heptose 1,7-bisphosphate phosphatase